MIEVIECPLYSARYSGQYKKCLVITLPEHGKEWTRVLILESIQSYFLPISKKRWKLIDKFSREGCLFKKASMFIDFNKKYHQRFWISLEEVIELGHIYDSNIVEELKKIDQEKEKS